MSTRDPIAALRADIGAASASVLATRVAESRQAAVEAIASLPESPARVALEAWLGSADDQAAAALRGPALSYGRLALAALGAYRPPAADHAPAVQAPPPAPAPAPPAPERHAPRPGSEGIYLGDPRDRPVTPPAPPAPGRPIVPPGRIPPKVRTAPAPPPAAPKPPRPVPQGRTWPGQPQPARRPLGPAPDDEEIPF